MMSYRIAALASALLLTGCPNKTTKPGDMNPNPDMSMVVEDLAGADQAVSDDLAGADLFTGDMADNHNLLQFPAEATPMKQDGGVDYYEMHVKEGQVQLLPGAKTTVWGFEGTWPGPTIKATLGRPVTVKVFNELPVSEPISIHNHGHNVPVAYDGHPSVNTIAQGASYEYHYPNMQEGGVAPNLHGAGLYFMHDHAATLTGPHVYKGMALLYLLSPPANSDESKLNLPSGNYDIPMYLADKAFNADNSLNYSPSVISGAFGSTLMVNGTVKPYIEVARRRYRFRVLNGSNSRIVTIGLSSGSFHQIGSDGGLFGSAITVTKVTLAPAERADLIIDFSQYPLGTTVTMTNTEASGPPQPEVIQFRVNRNETETSALPAALNKDFVRYTEASPPVTRTRTLVFDYDNGGGEWRINGKTYDASATEFTDTKLGDVEIWNLQNSDSAHPIPHPFHQHLVQFQVLDICDIPTTTDMGTTNCMPAPPSLSGWKDTVLVQSGKQVRVKMKFYYNGPEAVGTIFPAKYVFHCHNVEHEDHAMMLQQQISGP